jgi:6-phosphogluconolactonase
VVELQKILAVHPVAMAIGNGKLYVANGVSQFENLPRGSVTAYAIDGPTGRLEQINQVPLSLSATMPRDFAIAPDGRSLVVAIHGGGAYNVVSIETDGRLGRVTGILKEVGSGPHPLQAAAHPSAVVFDRQGRLLTADMGADKLSALALSDGELCVISRCEVRAGSGPGGIAFHPDGRRVYVANALDGSLSGFDYEASGGLGHRQTVRVSMHGDTAVLAMHPSGEVLYSSHGHELETWGIGADGDLRSLHRIDQLHATKLQMTPDGTRLFALSTGAMVAMKIDARTCLPLTPVKVASLSHPVSIAIV